MIHFSLIIAFWNRWSYTLLKDIYYRGQGNVHLIKKHGRQIGVKQVLLSVVDSAQITQTCSESSNWSPPHRTPRFSCILFLIPPKKHFHKPNLYLFTWIFFLPTSPLAADDCFSWTKLWIFFIILQKQDVLLIYRPIILSVLISEQISQRCFHICLTSIYLNWHNLTTLEYITFCTVQATCVQTLNVCPSRGLDSSPLSPH